MIYRLSLILLLPIILLLSCRGKDQQLRGQSNPYPDVVTGRLSVPENRSDSKSRKITIAYSVLRSRSSSPGLPIVFLQGGPGGAALPMTNFWANSPLREQHDIILFDPRGTGQSSSFCNSIGEAMIAVLARDLTVEAEGQEIWRLAQNCAEEMDQADVDRSAYHSGENAADLEALRLHLGLDRWILLGGSYGTRLGLKYLQEYQAADAAIFAGLFPPEAKLHADLLSNLHRSLKIVFAECERTSNCNATYPLLSQRFYRMLENLRIRPLSLSYNGRAFVLNVQDAILLIHQMLYDRRLIGKVPAFIQALETENPLPIQQAIANTERTFRFLNAPTYWSVIAYEEIAFNSEAEITADLAKNLELTPGPAFFASDPGILRRWHNYRSGVEEAMPLTVQTPMLLCNGTLDPITPPTNAEAALANFTNAHYFEFPNEGHVLFNSCFFQLVEAFISNNYQRPENDCPAKAPSLRFE